jgi:hypothetical protein
MHFTQVPAIAGALDDEALLAKLRIGGRKLTADFRRADRQRRRKLPVLRGNPDALVRFGGFFEVFSRTQAAASAMLRPLMLDQRCARHDRNHFVDRGRVDLFSRTILRPAGLFILRPQAVQHESELPAGCALGGVALARGSGAESWGPRKREQVKIEIAGDVFLLRIRRSGWIPSSTVFTMARTVTPSTCAATFRLLFAGWRLLLGCRRRGRIWIHGAASGKNQKHRNDEGTARFAGTSNHTAYLTAWLPGRSHCDDRFRRRAHW